MATFYLSSTFRDLKDYRQRVDAELRRAHYKVKSMENITASGAAPLATCLAEVAKCDAYIGIFAWRHGSIPEGGDPPDTSITHLEYLQAIKCKKETLVFLLKEGVSLEPADTDTTKIKELRKSLLNSHWIAEFGDPTELALAVVTAANSFRRRRFLKRLGKVATGSFILLVLAGLVVLLALSLKRSGPPNSNSGTPPIIQASPSPIIRVNPWQARFTKTLDQWRYTIGLWDTEAGEETVADKDALALLVKGNEMGIPKDLVNEVFEDFQALFKIRFKQGIGAAWVLRAQPDRRSGYLFEITKRGPNLVLSGWIYSQNLRSKKFAEETMYFNCCTPTQGLDIDVTVKGDTFVYTIAFEDDSEDPKSQVGEAVTHKFQVGNADSHWHWGTFGFLGTEDGSVMKVESLGIQPLPKTP